VIEPKLKYLHRFDFHPVYTYPLRRDFVRLSIDFKSEWTAKNSSRPDSVFSQLMMDHRVSGEELDVFTDGSKYSRTPIISSTRD